MREKTHGDLAMLQKMDPQQLSKFLENEHPQTVALVLAHLDPKRGSALLMHLDAALRVETVRRLAEMRQFSPEMAQKVGVMLHRRMEAMGSSGRKSYAGFKAVAEMLNRLDRCRARPFWKRLSTKEPKLAIGIPQLMFTFEDLLTVSEAEHSRTGGGGGQEDSGAVAEGSQGEPEGAPVQGDEYARGGDAEGRHGGDGAGAHQGGRARAAGDAGAGAYDRSRGRITLKLEADDELAV